MEQAGLTPPTRLAQYSSSLTLLMGPACLPGCGAVRWGSTPLPRTLSHRTLT